MFNKQIRRLRNQINTPLVNNFIECIYLPKELMNICQYVWKITVHYKNSQIIDNSNWKGTKIKKRKAIAYKQLNPKHRPGPIQKAALNKNIYFDELKHDV